MELENIIYNRLVIINYNRGLTRHDDTRDGSVRHLTKHYLMLLIKNKRVDHSGEWYSLRPYGPLKTKKPRRKLNYYYHSTV